MNLHLRVVPALTLVAALGCAAAAPAQATVSPSSLVSAADFRVDDFSIAMNPAGERSAVTLVGERGTRLQVLARLGRGDSLRPGRRLEDLRARSGSGGYARFSDPVTAVAPDGAAIAAWIVTTVASRDGQPSYRLRVSTASPNGSFGSPRTLMSSRSSQLTLTGAVAHRGRRAVLSWLRGNRVEVAVRSGSRFGTPRTIGSSRDYDGPPQLAISAGGTAVAAWSPTQGSAAMASVLRPTGRRFGVARSVSAPGERTAYARAVAGPGGTGVAWTVEAPSAIPAAGVLRFARMRTAAGTFAAPATLASLDTDGAPHVALPRLGVTTAWRQFTTHTEPGDTDSITASRLDGASSWLGGAAPKRLSEPRSLALRPVLAALGDRALVAWLEAPEFNVGTPVRLAVATAGGWQPTVTLPLDEPREGPPSRTFGIDAGERRSARDLAIAAGGRGALLGWVTSRQASDGSVSARLRIAAYAR